MYLKNNCFGCSLFICVLYYVYREVCYYVKKRTSYEVNVQGITFWRKIINEDNTEVFVKSSLNEPFMIYIDKVKGINILIGLREDLLIWKIWEKIFFLA